MHWISFGVLNKCRINNCLTNFHSLTHTYTIQMCMNVNTKNQCVQTLIWFRIINPPNKNRTTKNELRIADTQKERTKKKTTDKTTNILGASKPKYSHENAFSSNFKRKSLSIDPFIVQWQPLDQMLLMFSIHFFVDLFEQNYFIFFLWHLKCEK